MGGEKPIKGMCAEKMQTEKRFYFKKRKALLM